MGNTTEGQILTRSLMALLAHRRNKKKDTTPSHFRGEQLYHEVGEVAAPVRVERDVGQRSGQRVGDVEQLVDVADAPRQVRQPVEDVGRVVQFAQLRLVRADHGQSDAEQHHRSFTASRKPQLIRRVLRKKRPFFL